MRFLLVRRRQALPLHGLAHVPAHAPCGQPFF